MVVPYHLDAISIMTLLCTYSRATKEVWFSTDGNLKMKNCTDVTNRIAMFAQPKESLPLRDWKKTASSLAPQATDEGGWSASSMIS